MSDFVTYASNRGDIAGRMKRWEPCYCGPEPRSYNNFDDWESFFSENTKTQFFKTNKAKGLKEVNPSKFGAKIKKCLSSKGIKVGIFVGLIALGATALFASDNSFNTTA